MDQSVLKRYPALFTIKKICELPREMVNKIFDFLVLLDDIYIIADRSFRHVIHIHHNSLVNKEIHDVKIDEKWCVKRRKDKKRSLTF